MVPEPSTPSASATTSERDELRTISFRLRELQRLLGARVEQENRRLAAEGIEPVTDPRLDSNEPPEEIADE